MDHVAAAALTAVVVARRLIALAICGAIIVDQNAVLMLLLLTHVGVIGMHVLIQVIMVEMIMMMTVCAIRRDVRS